MQRYEIMVHDLKPQPGQDALINMQVYLATDVQALAKEMLWALKHQSGK